jgi:hypothetical protein
VKTVYMVKCLQCGLKPRTRYEDPDDRDNAAIEHYKKYGHRKFRRWTADLFIDNPVEYDE